MPGEFSSILDIVAGSAFLQKGFSRRPIESQSTPTQDHSGSRASGAVEQWIPPPPSSTQS
jgi:hypothetical protein